jgi:maltose alpha-D-glucosyltransferase/alpha-amylase
VRSFYDASGDGIGDLAGLTEKLDYLQDLGVTALWLLPFYPSPGRDDGYDIADYTGVHADVGTLDDFKVFLAEAHRRGLRVITELVLNHTSDQHPWFQRARRAPEGSPERQFYVWSDTVKRYTDARIIFKDFEHSNWTWDPVAKAYFWHRFYAHQPDLNFESPDVRRAILEAVDFWLALGVDGLRLDAVPYLYAAEGTDCENLPETHAFLKKLRSHVDEKFSERLLLAEANQWPEDAVAYFGDGDECQMAFHFPIMPRLFMSIHMEDRFPLVDILAQTPAIPANCQWALFLRNHDELTLEMVTDDERDYMYRAYAHDPTMRINLGIRRRLAPLMGGDRRNIELMNALLLSLPGTPVLYYGDELGMGDNVFLGDRNGVRTPMQWSADRNAGFSRANPQRLILPVIIDPEYHYESINVEAQQNNPSSLLWWMKRMIALRKRSQAFGRGTIEFLNLDNPCVLGFVRHYEGDAVLVIANLSRFVQCAQVDLSKYKGLMPVELLGGTKLPVLDEAPAVFTLGPHGYYWFGLERPKTAEADARAASYVAMSIELKGAAPSFFSAEHRRQLQRVVGAWIATRPWFGSSGRQVTDVVLTEVVPIASAGAALHATIAEVHYTSGPPERYFLPLCLVSGERLEELRRRAPQAILATLLAPSTERTRGPDGELWLLVDGLAEPEACRALLDAVEHGFRGRGVASEVVGAVDRPISSVSSEGAPLEVRVQDLDLLRPSVVFGDKLILRLFRRLEDGISPDLEIGRMLSDAESSEMALRVVGALEQRSRGSAVTLAVLREFVSNEGDAWLHARTELGRYFERALTRPDLSPPASPGPPLLELASAELPLAASELIGPYLERMRLLGRRAAELHAALAAPTEVEAFASEPYSMLDLRSRYQAARNTTARVLRLLRANLLHVAPDAALDAEILLHSENQILDWFEELLENKLTARRTRCHGYYRLERLLYTGKDFVVMDFDGDNARSLAERRRKRSPLYDVASMVRSLHNAAWSAVRTEEIVRKEDREAAEPWADVWGSSTAATFVASYLEHAADAAYLPAGRAELTLLLDTYILEAALHQLEADLLGRSEATGISLRSIRKLLESR